MKRNVWAGLGLIVLTLGTLLLTVQSGLAQVPLNVAFEAPSPDIPPPRLNVEELLKRRPRSQPPLPTSSQPTDCALQPEKQASALGSVSRMPLGALTLERFRRLAAAPGTTAAAKQIPDYQPKEEIALADATNFGDRFLRDVNGSPADLTPIVVLHETVGSANSAISLFLNYHPNDDDQVSYHTLVRRDGTLIYIVPPDKRAFGAGNSIFMGSNGLETVQTKIGYPPSVNNFAYHISLETPPDGNHNGYNHSGYTPQQYQSLAWLVAKTGVDNTRITTHKAVDRSRSRIDPRTFDTGLFQRLLSGYPRTTEVAIRCTDPTQRSLTPATPSQSTP